MNLSDQLSEQDSIGKDENALNSDSERIIQENKILNKINTSSKFFYEIDYDEELKNDFDDDELE